MRLWMFSDFSVPTEAHIRQYAECGFSDVVLGVTTERSKFKLNYTESKWLKACELIRHYGMKPHFMVWAVRQQAFIEQTFEVLEPMMVKGDVSSLMFDAEGTWHKGRQMTVPAAVSLIESLRSKRSLGVTGLDRLHSTVKPLAEICDYILPQSYSFWKPKSLCGGKKHWSHSAHTFPGPQQRKAYESWWLTFPKKSFVMGLACYWGDRPKQGVAPAVSDAQSMRMAMAETVAVWHEAAAKDSAHSEGTFWGAAYWSGKHSRGNSKQKQDRRAFFRMVREA